MPDPDLSKYTAGQKVVCRILLAEKGGYTACLDGNDCAFLYTDTVLKAGDKVTARVMGISDRVLLTDQIDPRTDIWWSQESGKPPKGDLPKFSERSEMPLTQTEADRGGSGRPPRKTALGYSDDGGDNGLIPGQTVSCKVTKAEPGGYAVLVETKKKTLPGFIPTQKSLNLGEQISAKFICVDNERLLLDIATDNSRSVLPLSELSRVHIKSQVNRKRGTDLILPALDAGTERQFKMSECGLDGLIATLEGGLHTGCVRATSQEWLSRSLMLLHQGRVVGCMYSCKANPEVRIAEQSLQLMLADLRRGDTEVTQYELPESIVLPLSSLFLGYPVQRNDDFDARSYFDYICNWFESRKATVCLVITLPSPSSFCLSFIYKGAFTGAFYVDDQQFTKEKEFVYDLCGNEPRATVEASILAPEMIASGVPFGFNLSRARKNLPD